MEKNLVDQLEEYESLSQLHDNFYGPADNRQRRGTLNNGRRRMLRVRTGPLDAPNFAVVKMNHADHANIFKKIGKGLKKAATAVKKVTLKVTPKPLRKVVGKIITVHEKVTKAVGKGIGKAAKAVGKVVGKVISYPALLPLMPVMGSALKKVKIKPSSDPGRRAQQFYKFVIKKEKPDTGDDGFDRDDILPALAAIIPAVIGFIKALVQKGKAKKAGKEVAMSELDASIAGEAAGLLDQISAEIVDDKIGANDPVGNPSVLSGPLQGDSPLIMGGESRSAKGTRTKSGVKVSGVSSGLSFSNPIVLAVGGAVLLLIVVLIARKR